MILSKKALLYKIVTTLVLLIFSVSTMAAAFSQNQILAYQGDAEAQYSLGLSYLYAYGVSQNYSKAVEWFQEAANQGHAEAQFVLGVIYGNGTGVR